MRLNCIYFKTDFFLLCISRNKLHGNKNSEKFYSHALTRCQFGLSEQWAFKIIVFIFTQLYGKNAEIVTSECGISQLLQLMLIYINKVLKK